MKRILFSLLLLSALAMSTTAEDKADLAVVHRIKAEALDNSKVMDHVFYLTDVYGPRLTGSPAFRQSADWAMKRMKEWGLDDVKTEKWGTFGRSWTLVRFSGHLVEPQHSPLIGFPLAWTPGTKGPVSAEPVLATIPIADSEEDLDKAIEQQKGKLRGKIVLVDVPREVTLPTTPLASRYTDAGLAAEALAPDPKADWPFAVAKGGPTREVMKKRLAKRNKFLTDEGALVVITPGYRGDSGTVFGAGAGSRETNEPLPPPTVAIATEQYNRIARLLHHKVPVRLEFDIETKFHEDEPDGYNVLADIPGGRKKDEVVILGAHLDSWHGGTGAADNAAGVAVMMEAARILRALNLRMDRTLRVALWSAEENGLLGSKGYVKEHFADPETMAPQPEHAKLAAYFNVDNGSGKIRGVYLQGNDMVRPIFAAWLEPFHDMGAKTLSIRNTSGTDHLPFDEVGLPGFQFIQDELEYSTRIHHSNMDVYDHIQGGDLMQASAIMASFAYHAAMRDEMLPRKPLPKPRPKKEEKK